MADLPDTLDEATAKELAGDHWDADTFRTFAAESKESGNGGAGVISKKVAQEWAHNLRVVLANPRRRSTSWAAGDDGDADAVAKVFDRHGGSGDAWDTSQRDEGKGE